MKYLRIILFMGLVSTWFASCVNEPLDNSSFGLLQSRILNTSCAITTCHSSSTDATFTEHHLVLSAEVAYENLVGALPTNNNAVNDGLLRVKPFSSDESLLFHKLHASSGHHGSDYGNPMPLGLPKLSVGQLEFIREWIDAGAPEDGVVTNPEYLDDTTPQPDAFEPLDPPASGYQVVIPAFSIAPNFERELFVYKSIGNTTDIFVNRVEVKMRDNSHHLAVYDFDGSIPGNLMPLQNVVRDIRNLDGTLIIENILPMAYHIFVAGSQTTYYNFEFPAGVAIRLPANTALDFNSHYVNKQNVPIEGVVNVNFHTVPSGAVLKLAETLNLPNSTFVLPPNQVTVATKSFNMTEKTYIISLTSHTHKLATQFIIKIKGGIRDGEVVYTSTEWHHPEVIVYDPPIELNPGEGLTSEITYNNTKNIQVSFGLTSEDEMGIIFGYFYKD